MPIRTWLHRNSMLDTAPKKTRAEVTVGTPVVELTPSKNAALTREWVFWCRSMILKLQAGRREKRRAWGIDRRKTSASVRMPLREVSSHPQTHLSIMFGPGVAAEIPTTLGTVMFTMNVSAVLAVE